MTKQTLIHALMKNTITTPNGEPSQIGQPHQLYESSMEEKKRTLTKALTWQAIGFALMTAINYFYLGSLREGVGLSTLLTLMGLFSYYWHERLWARISWGQLTKN